MERAALPNPPQVGIRVEPPADGIDPIDSLLEVINTPVERNELSIFPAVDEGAEDLHNVGQDNGFNNQDGLRRLAQVDLAAANGAEAPANEELQQMEQEDLLAVQSILPERPIPTNVVTGRLCWLVLQKLRDNLPKEGSQRMPHGQEFARILERSARMMTIPSQQDYESAHCAHRDFPLNNYEDLFKVVEGMTPEFSCPLDDGEFLDRLLEDMTATSTLMRVGDGVYVSKDREQYARRLRSLAARV